MMMGGNNRHVRGFTLIEMLVTMVIAMVILGGLLLSFMQQNTEYRYQNKRIDAVQNLEFTIGFIADDLRNALIDQGIAITDVGAGADIYTSQVDIYSWEMDVSFWDSALQRNDNDYIAARIYSYDKAGESLQYDRNAIPTVNFEEVLPDVTDFRVFLDVPGAQPEITPGNPFPGSPPGLQSLDIQDSGGGIVSSPSYTILIEVAVDAGYKEGSFLNARGVDVRTFETPGRKRVWRYAQVHPLSVSD